jgi:hypothetical protein
MQRHGISEEEAKQALRAQIPLSRKLEQAKKAIERYQEALRLRPNSAAALAQMFAAFQLLVFERQGKPKLPQDPLIKQYANRIHTLRLPQNLDHISSTEVRQRIRAGQSIEELVPSDVAAYVNTQNLYKNQPE